MNAQNLPVHSPKLDQLLERIKTTPEIEQALGGYLAYRMFINKIQASQTSSSLDLQKLRALFVQTEFYGFTGKMMSFVLNHKKNISLDFVLVVLQGNPQQTMATTGLSHEEVKSHLLSIQGLVGTFPKSVNSYFT